MKSLGASREGVTKVLRNLPLVTAVSLLVGLLWLCAPPEAATTGGTKKTAQEAKLRLDWHKAMMKVPHPKKKGTFEATYPNKVWREVKSVKAPRIPMVPPRGGPRPLVVGNRNNVSAQAPTGLITSALGTFDSVTGVTSETGLIGNSGSPVANAYTLQINTNPFTSTACAGSPNSGCQGWQQFVFFNDGTSGTVFIQYWLLKYDKTCPPGAGWNQFSFTGSTDIYCWKNATMASGVPNQPISNLANLRLSGTVSKTGDSYFFSTGSTMVSGTGDNAVNAAAGWNTAEFGVFGAGGSAAGGGQANFNSGAKVVTRTHIDYGGTAAPNCVATGFTGETNNLNFGPSAPVVAPHSGPAVVATETSGGGASSNCAAATSVGDTHLTTFHGLLYDFQASGDFVLAQADPDFVVHTRQKSGAPNWPNASVNSAVATRMGKTTVAISVGKQRLVINGRTTNLNDGKAISVSTADGVDVTRRGNVYYITDKHGNSVRATINDSPKMSWIDVLVGLGHCCSKAQAKGLLANANDNVNHLAMRNGTVLKHPFSFNDLYHRYGESWRVSPKESLLSVFGKSAENANPKEPFYAHHLDPKLHEKLHAVAKKAGVKHDAHLDAAILDMAVLGNEKAAHAFVSAHPPVLVHKHVAAGGK
jgi:hypothetical protein